MNELQVIVDQQPGIIRWNFEELKMALRESMESYKSLVYTDATIPEAKADLAMLRKLRTAVEDRRKEIKKKCMEPYDIIEKQAKELTGFIDEPINLIAKQVTDYENEQKRRRKDEIMKYMAEKFECLPGTIAKKAQFKVYDPRWENATAKKKDWMAAVDACLADVQRSIGIINGVDEEFREQAMEIYSRDLELSAAIAKAQELQQQKQRILEAERRRQEEAERRRKEREEAEARRKAAEEAVHAAAAQHPAPAAAPTACQPAQPVNVWNEKPAQGVGAAIESVERTAFSAAAAPTRAAAPARKEDTVPWGNPAQNAPQAATAERNDGSILLRVYGTPQEQKKILDFIGFMGVRCDKL